MRWAAEHPDAPQIAAAYERWGQEIPDGLIEPLLHDIEGAIFEAFLDLSTDRPIGMSAGQIPSASIARVEADWEFLGYGVFHRLIRAMDGALLSAQAEKQKSGRTGR